MTEQTQYNDTPVKWMLYPALAGRFHEKDLINLRARARARARVRARKFLRSRASFKNSSNVNQARKVESGTHAGTGTGTKVYQIKYTKEGTNNS